MRSGGHGFLFLLLNLPENVAMSRALTLRHSAGAWISIVLASLLSACTTDNPFSDAEQFVENGFVPGTSVQFRDPNNRQLVLTTDAGVIVRVRSIAQPQGADPTKTYPHGFFEATIEGLPPGGALELSLELPSGSVPAGVVSCGGDGACADAPGVAIAGNGIVLTLRDGTEADVDGAANGSLRHVFAPYQALSGEPATDDPDGGTDSAQGGDDNAGDRPDDGSVAVPGEGSGEGGGDAGEGGETPAQDPTNTDDAALARFDAPGDFYSAFPPADIDIVGVEIAGTGVASKGYSSKKGVQSDVSLIEGNFIRVKVEMTAGSKDENVTVIVALAEVPSDLQLNNGGVDRDLELDKNIRVLHIENAVIKAGGGNVELTPFKVTDIANSLQGKRGTSGEENRALFVYVFQAGDTFTKTLNLDSQFDSSLLGTGLNISNLPIINKVPYVRVILLKDLIPETPNDTKLFKVEGDNAGTPMVFLDKNLEVAINPVTQGSVDPLFDLPFKVVTTVPDEIKGQNRRLEFESFIEVDGASFPVNCATAEAVGDLNATVIEAVNRSTASTFQNVQNDTYSPRKARQLINLPSSAVVEPTELSLSCRLEETVHRALMKLAGDPTQGEAPKTASVTIRLKQDSQLNQLFDTEEDLLVFPLKLACLQSPPIERVQEGNLPLPIPPLAPPSPSPSPSPEPEPEGTLEPVELVNLGPLPTGEPVPVGGKSSVTCPVGSTEACGGTKRLSAKANEAAYLTTVGRGISDYAETKDKREYRRQWGSQSKIAAEVYAMAEYGIDVFPIPHGGASAETGIRVYTFNAKNDIIRLESSFRATVPLYHGGDPRAIGNGPSTFFRDGLTGKMTLLNAVLIDRDAIQNGVVESANNAAERKQQEQKARKKVQGGVQSSLDLNQEFDKTQLLAKVNFTVGPVPIGIEVGLNMELPINLGLEPRGFGVAIVGGVSPKMQIEARGGVDAKLVFAGIKVDFLVLEVKPEAVAGVKLGFYVPGALPDCGHRPEPVYFFNGVRNPARVKWDACAQEFFQLRDLQARLGFPSGPVLTGSLYSTGNVPVKAIEGTFGLFARVKILPYPCGHRRWFKIRWCDAEKEFSYDIYTTPALVDTTIPLWNKQFPLPGIRLY